MFAHTFKFDNGETLKDIVTGFVGVVVSRSSYMTGYDLKSVGKS